MSAASTAPFPLTIPPLGTYAEVRQKVAQLPQMSLKERALLSMANDIELKKLEEALDEQLQSPDDTVASNAAYLIGRYRVSRSASQLAHRITLRDPTRPRDYFKSLGEDPVGSGLWLWSPLPAFEALIQIGTPSIDPLIGNLSSESEHKVREMSLECLFRVCGSDKNLTKFYVQRALAKEHDKSRAQQLQLTLKELPDVDNGKE